MAVIKTIEKGESLTFGFVLPETYNLDNLQAVKIYIGSSIYEQKMDGRTVRVELESNQTALITGRNIVHFVIDDAVFGIKKINCGELEVLPTQATHKDESVNTGYDVEIVLSINVETVSIGSVLYNTLKGEKGDAGTIEVGTVTTGDAGTDVIVENVGTPSEAVLNFTIPRGDAGYTPYIGGNRNWFINGVDTGVQAEGDATESWVGQNYLNKLDVVGELGGDSNKVINQQKVSEEFEKRAGLELERGKNLFNKENVIHGYYIQASTGKLQAYENASISPLIELVEFEDVYHVTRTSNLEAPQLRFIAADGVTPIKPIDASTSEEYTNYSIPRTTPVKRPAGAKYVQFTCQFNGVGDLDIIQFEIGNEGTSYEPYSEKKVLSNDEIPREISELPEKIYQLDGRVSELEKQGDKKLRISRNGEFIFIAQPFDDTYDLCNKINAYRGGSSSNNDNIVFEMTYTILKGNVGHSASLHTLLKSEIDDTSPINTNFGWYAGAHGFGAAKKLTLSNHGKTFVNIGSKWIDVANNRTWIILQIVDNDNIIIASESNSVWGNPSNPLVSVDAIENTDTMTGYTITSVSNLYQFMKRIYRRIFADDIDITDELSGSEVIAKEINIEECYRALDPKSVFDRLSDLNGTFNSNPDYIGLNADSLFQYTSSYRMLANKTISTHVDVSFIKDTYINRFPGVQAGCLPGSSGLKLLIPKTVPFSANSVDYDFANGQNWNSNLPGGIFLTPDRWAYENNPPTRACNYSSSYRFNIGIVPDVENGVEIKDGTLSFELSSIRKIYPNYSPVKQFYSGESICLAGFRNYDNTVYENRFNFFTTEASGWRYYFVDYNSDCTDEIDISDLAGHEIVLIEKSSEVSFGRCAASKIPVTVFGSENNFTYFVFKVKL